MRPFVSHVGTVPGAGIRRRSETENFSCLRGLGCGKSITGPQGVNDELSGGGRTKKKKKKTLMNRQLCTFIKGKKHKGTATGLLI